MKNFHAINVGVFKVVRQIQAHIIYIFCGFGEKCGISKVTKLVFYKNSQGISDSLSEITISLLAS